MKVSFNEHNTDKMSKVIKSVGAFYELQSILTLLPLLTIWKSLYDLILITGMSFTINLRVIGRTELDRLITTQH